MKMNDTCTIFVGYCPMDCTSCEYFIGQRALDKRFTGWGYVNKKNNILEQIFFVEGERLSGEEYDDLENSELQEIVENKLGAEIVSQMKSNEARFVKYVPAQGEAGHSFELVNAKADEEGYFGHGAVDSKSFIEELRFLGVMD